MTYRVPPQVLSPPPEVGGWMRWVESQIAGLARQNPGKRSVTAIDLAGSAVTYGAMQPGALDTFLITSPNFQSSVPGGGIARWAGDADGLHFFDAAGVETADLATESGNFFMTGTFQTAAPGSYPSAILQDKSHTFGWTLFTGYYLPPSGLPAVLIDGSGVSPAGVVSPTVTTVEQQIGLNFVFDAAQAYPAQITGVKATTTSDSAPTQVYTESGIIRMRTGRIATTDAYTAVGLQSDTFSIDQYVAGSGVEDYIPFSTQGDTYVRVNPGGMNFVSGTNGNAQSALVINPNDGTVLPGKALRLWSYNGRASGPGIIASFEAGFGPDQVHWDSRRTEALTPFRTDANFDWSVAALDTRTDTVFIGGKTSAVVVSQNPKLQYQANPYGLTPAPVDRVSATITGVDLTGPVTASSTLAVAGTSAMHDVNITGNLTVSGTFPGAVAAPSGAIMMWPNLTPPAGWVVCDGSSQLRAGTYAAIFAIAGTTFGAVDGTHFNLPPMPGMVPVGYKAGDADFGTLGGTGGAKTVAGAAHTHTSAAHTHDVLGSAHTHDVLGSSHTHGSSTLVAQVNGTAAAGLQFIINRRAATSWSTSHAASSGALAASVNAGQTTGAAVVGSTDATTPTTVVAGALTTTPATVTNGATSTTPGATGSTAPTATSVIQPYVTMIYIIKL